MRLIRNVLITISIMLIVVLVIVLNKTSQQRDVYANAGTAPLSVAAPTSIYGTRRQELIDQQATVFAMPRPPKVISTSDPPSPLRITETPDLGILPFPQSIMFDHQARIKNMWAGKDGEQYVHVYAGWPRADRQQGFIGVEVGDAFNSDGTSKVYYTPIRVGAVHITAANGTQLTLETDNGVIFVFDWKAGQFLNVPPSNYPTATPGAPLPTPTLFP